MSLSTVSACSIKTLYHFALIWPRLQDQHGASLATLMESGKKGRVSDRLVKLVRLYMTSFYLTPGLAGYVFKHVQKNKLFAYNSNC